MIINMCPPEAITVLTETSDRWHPDSIGLAAVTVIRSEKILLNNITLSLSTNGITAVMGHNGAGKSLLLRVLHGLIQPTRGQVLLPTTDQGHTVRQSMVFQKPVLLRRSVSANLRFALSINSACHSDCHDELLDRVGLLNKATQPARALSGGEQQRLALVRALALNPRILFLDEPTASLDPHSALIIENILQEESDRGTKLVLVTHDIAQARRLADEVVFLHKGNLREQTLSDQFFDQPCSPEAHAYLEGRLHL